MKRWWWGETERENATLLKPSSCRQTRGKCWSVEQKYGSEKKSRLSMTSHLVLYWLCVFWGLVAKPKGDNLPAMWELDLWVSDCSNSHYHDATVSGHTLPKTYGEWPGKPCGLYVPDALGTVIQLWVTCWKSSPDRPNQLLNYPANSHHSLGTRLSETRLQVKEGGASLHKTITEIYKGLIQLSTYSHTITWKEKVLQCSTL